MFDRRLTSLSFGQMIHGGVSHCISHHSPDSGAQGPGAGPEALSCGHPHLGLAFSRRETT